ncbi:MAG: hypothetical protein ACI4NM_11505, partial [Bullifex sp.]
DFLYTSVRMLDSSDVFEYEPDWDAVTLKDSPPARPPEKLSLTDVVNVIITATPSTDVTGDSRRDIMLEYLRESENRRRFMLFLLANTDSLTTGEITDLSELMNVSENCFAELSVLLYALTENRHESSEQKFDHRINKAWKRYVMLSAAIHDQKTTDEEKKELMFQLDAALRNVRAKQDRKAVRKRGLSISFISGELGYPTSMISSSVRQVENFIEALSGEVKAGA